jgi:hypothetical protein
MKQTLLGNPRIRPWQHHAALVDDFQMESRSRRSSHSELIAEAERQL